MPTMPDDEVFVSKDTRYLIDKAAELNDILLNTIIEIDRILASRNFKKAGKLCPTFGIARDVIFSLRVSLNGAHRAMGYMEDSDA